MNSSFETKAVKKGSKSLKIAGYANTITKDRAGDVVTAEAWAKGVENYRRNPVLLYQHKHDAPIGRVDKITVDKKESSLKLQFLKLLKEIRVSKP